MIDQAGGLLTVAETARLLRRSTEQVRRYLREGTLPGRRLGGQWFIVRHDAETFLARRAASADFPARITGGDPDPLGTVIALAGSGGGDIARGRMHYARVAREGSR